MRHYIISVSNLKSTGRIDEASTKRFLLTINDESIDFTAAISVATEEIHKRRISGLLPTTRTSSDLVDLAGKLSDYGEPWIANDRFEIRDMD